MLEGSENKFAVEFRVEAGARAEGNLNSTRGVTTPTVQKVHSESTNTS